ncbi:uncharacterized protein BDR25DRAFT_310807 [Lindgomyces ingoldianus]|uniref:Uncharacterized protein n=1 Tax=Lindgomyces ingoldianus TaxID=673940 RepID=A0ACB6R857_9PLEO|nr:uncharacterized protein BDR25DRAFT_310807 [Lindgomyces ingoldianus]KAF2475434.1 hypothetical protein BDR25DRAFT_310807 [Lindgomyces ingoldianus]
MSMNRRRGLPQRAFISTFTSCEGGRTGDKSSQIASRKGQGNTVVKCWIFELLAIGIRAQNQNIHGAPTRLLSNRSLVNVGAPIGRPACIFDHSRGMPASQPKTGSFFEDTALAERMGGNSTEDGSICLSGFWDASVVLSLQEQKKQKLKKSHRRPLPGILRQIKPTLVNMPSGNPGRRDRHSVAWKKRPMYLLAHSVTIQPEFASSCCKMVKRKFHAELIKILTFTKIAHKDILCTQLPFKSSTKFLAYESVHRAHYPILFKQNGVLSLIHHPKIATPAFSSTAVKISTSEICSGRVVQPCNAANQG